MYLVLWNETGLLFLVSCPMINNDKSMITINHYEIRCWLTVIVRVPSRGGQTARWGQQNCFYHWSFSQFSQSLLFWVLYLCVTKSSTHSRSSSTAEAVPKSTKTDGFQRRFFDFFTPGGLRGRGLDRSENARPPWPRACKLDSRTEGSELFNFSSSKFADSGSPHSSVRALYLLSARQDGGILNQCIRTIRSRSGLPDVWHASNSANSNNP